MPKSRRTKRSIPGVLGNKPHPYHRHWVFSYSQSKDGYEDTLDNDDLEMCAKKNQIKIVSGSVLMYIGERATSVTVDVYLPCQVTMVIIHKYGIKNTFCFATVGGAKKPSVFPGCDLKKNPHAKRL